MVFQQTNPEALLTTCADTDCSVVVIVAIGSTDVAVGITTSTTLSTDSSSSAGVEGSAMTPCCTANRTQRSRSYDNNSNNAYPNRNASTRRAENLVAVATPPLVTPMLAVSPAYVPAAAMRALTHSAISLSYFHGPKLGRPPPTRRDLRIWTNPKLKYAALCQYYDRTSLSGIFTTTD